MAATTVPIMQSVYLRRKKFMVGMFEANRELAQKAIVEILSKAVSI